MQDTVQRADQVVQLQCCALAAAVRLPRRVIAELAGFRRIDTREADVLANGVTLALSGIPGFWDLSPTGAVYGQLTGVFTAASTSTTISIAGRVLGSEQFMIGLDDVSVSAVPLPAALPLLGTALVGLGAIARRRSRLGA